MVQIRYRGVEQLEARRAHNPEVVGSSPASATRKRKTTQLGGLFFFLFASAELVLCSLGYESDERSSLGLNGLALPVADAARPFSCAAVGEGRRCAVTEDIRRAPQQDVG